MGLFVIVMGHVKTKTEMPDYYHIYCKKCEGKIVMHTFSEGEYTVCEKKMSTSHTPCDKVCRECSIEKDVCMSCGGPMQKPYREISKKDIEEAVNYVFNERPKKDPNEKVIKFAIYCKGRNGARFFSAENPNLCADSECKNCRNFEKLLKEAAEEWADETLKQYPLDPSECFLTETSENLTPTEVIEKYGAYLSEDQIKNLKNLE